MDKGKGNMNEKREKEEEEKRYSLSMDESFRVEMMGHEIFEPFNLEDKYQYYRRMDIIRDLANEYCYSARKIWENEVETRGKKRKREINHRPLHFSSTSCSRFSTGAAASSLAYRPSISTISDERDQPSTSRNPKVARTLNFDCDPVIPVIQIPESSDSEPYTPLPSPVHSPDPWDQADEENIEDWGDEEDEVYVWELPKPIPETVNLEEDEEEDPEEDPEEEIEEDPVENGPNFDPEEYDENNDPDGLD